MSDELRRNYFSHRTVLICLIVEYLLSLVTVSNQDYYKLWSMQSTCCWKFSV